MKNIFLALIGICALALFFWGADFGAHTTLDQNAGHKLDQLFDRLLEKNKGMGSLVLAKDGKVIYSRSFGYRQITENDKKPLTADTKYRIGSITKMYTAMMIFQLVEEGKLELTDTLDKFFPQIPNAGRHELGQHLGPGDDGFHERKMNTLYL